MIEALALAWAAIAAGLGARGAERITIAGRLRARRTRRRSRLRYIGAWPPLAMTARVVGAPARRRRDQRRADTVARELATAVDLVGVAAAAGCTPYLAVQVAARWSPPRVGVELREIPAACARGRSFDDALRDTAARARVFRPLTDALGASARLGSPAAPALARVGAELRADLRRRAEARARTVPVRLCFPLVGCILPAFALLIVVPVVLGGLRG